MLGFGMKMGGSKTIIFKPSYDRFLDGIGGYKTIILCPSYDRILDAIGGDKIILFGWIFW